MGLSKSSKNWAAKSVFDSEVTRIEVVKEGKRKVAKGVTLANGTRLAADLVVSNGDYASTYLNLIEPQHRFWNRDVVVKARKQSMSLFVIYFGFLAPPKLELRHHNIILGPRYENC